MRFTKPNTAYSVALGNWSPTPGPPPAETVRPNAPHDPAVEFVEERSDVYPQEERSTLDSTSACDALDGISDGILTAALSPGPRQARSTVTHLAALKPRLASPARP
jgi:hypothetical protein